MDTSLVIIPPFTNATLVAIGKGCGMSGEIEYKDDDILTAQEAADYLKVKHVQTIYDYIHSGRLEAEKFGRSWMIRFYDLRNMKPSKPMGRPPKSCY